jgi:hypothetical protein
MFQKQIIIAICFILAGILTSCFQNKDRGELSSGPDFGAPDTFNYDPKTDPFADHPKQDSIDPVAALVGKDFYFFITEYRDQFKHTNIRQFKRCAIQDLNRQQAIFTIHTPVTRKLAYKVFQDHKYVLPILHEETKVLYSIQAEKGHQGILIAGMDEDWVDRIYYYSYTLDGRLISKCCLYECGGDGGSSSASFGEFANDSTYIRTSIYRDPINEDLTKLSYDSTVSKIIIHSNGCIEELKN